VLDADTDGNLLGNIRAQRQDFEQMTPHMINRQGRHFVYERYVTDLFWFRECMVFLAEENNTNLRKSIQGMNAVEDMKYNQAFFDASFFYNGR
jgi:hypothetical protein